MIAPEGGCTMQDNRSAIWGGATLGIIIGLIVGLVSGVSVIQGLFFGALIGAAFGVAANLLGIIADKLGNR